jgi:hypothetical protein
MSMETPHNEHPTPHKPSQNYLLSYPLSVVIGYLHYVLVLY